MKYVFWGLVVVLVSPVAASADDQVQVPWANKFFAPNPKEPPPVIVHDFGTVPWGTTLTHRFVIHNIYAVPMQIIDNPQPGCSCTRVTGYTKEKLGPHDMGYVDVEMNGRNFQGAKVVNIPVRFGPQFLSTAVLQVRAFARTDVIMQPGQINFGNVALGKQQPEQVINVQYTGQQPNWAIIAADAGGAPNSKTTALLERLPAQRNGVSYRLTVKLKPNAEAGELREQIMLKTNDPNSPVLTVPVSGAVRASLSIVQGAQVRLDPTVVGQETTRNIMIRADKTFRVAKVDGEGDGLSVKYIPIPNPTQTVTVRFKPTQAGELRRKLTFVTDQNETVSVTIEATAEAAKP